MFMKPRWLATELKSAGELNLPGDVNWSPTGLVALVDQPKNFLLTHLFTLTLKGVCNIGNHASMYRWEEASLLEVQIFAQWDAFPDFCCSVHGR